jgi:hypothetical protein
MTNKYFLIKIFGVASLILIIILYFLLYFIPSVKSINLYKRQLKDLNLKISDFIKMETAFTFSNETERDSIEMVEKELKGKIPEVKNKQDFIRLFTEVSNYIQKLAAKDGIVNMVVNSDSRELRINAGALSTDQKTLNELLNFAFQRSTQFQKEIKGKQSAPGINGASEGISSLAPGIQYQSVTLSFTAPLKNALNFTNHIPWGPYYLTEDKIIISTGSPLPYHIVFLKIYYIDNSATDAAENKR